MLKEDIKIAQQIVSLKFNNLHKKESYHNHSFIYKFTNEEIMNYQKYLKNRKRIFSITASPDLLHPDLLHPNLLHPDPFHTDIRGRPAFRSPAPDGPASLLLTSHKAHQPAVDHILAHKDLLLLCCLYLNRPGQQPRRSTGSIPRHIRCLHYTCYLTPPVTAATCK